MSGLGRVSPSSGVRLELTLTSVGADQVQYACVVRTGQAVYEGQAQISRAAHEVQLIGLHESPEWAQTFASNLLRTMARGVSEERWPRRLTRWRSEPTRSKARADNP